MTTTDLILISAIADRAMRVINYDRDKISWMMDIEAVHKSMGLKLESLLVTDLLNFVHDLAGIANYLNRKTGQLENCFVPRYAS